MLQFRRLTARNSLFQPRRSLTAHRPGLEGVHFLAQGWVDRVLTDKIGEGNVTNVCEWLGQDDWQAFKALGSRERAQYFVKRFKNDLGYKHAKPFPIFQKGNEGKIMFWMIHASDHDRAIPLMETAYTGVGLSLPPEPLEQLDFLVMEEFESPPRP